MKIYLPLVCLLTAFLCSCTPPEDRAIHSYMKQVLNDPDSYDPDVSIPVMSAITFPRFQFFHEYIMSLFPYMAKVRDVTELAAQSRHTEVKKLGVPLEDLRSKLSHVMEIDIANYDSLENNLNILENRLKELVDLLNQKYWRDYVDSFLLPIKYLADATTDLNEVREKYRKWSSQICVPLKDLPQFMTQECVYSHTYRARNGFGGMMMHTDCFILSPDKKKVECSVDVDLE